ncbi:MAG: tripartite tricarboxylate transporter substrate binding protein [Betaproteobacteria bacterium]|nr:tripartite tricarboxylate transporter substrate binding protein [Betaproteobacteria bacterium]
MWDARKVPGIAVAFCAGAWLAQPVFAAQDDAAKDYPNKPIRLIVPFVPGAGTDTTARTIAKKLTAAWGQQVVVDNRPGAAGTIALETTALAIPDGYTICLISASQTVNSATNPKLPYDLEKDLRAITQAVSLFYVLFVSPSVPATSVKELIAHARANPRKLNFGSSGTGGLQHFAGEMFGHLAGIKFTHVPYKGGAALIVGMLAGDIQVGFTALVGVKSHMASGRVRVLAITAKQRSPAMPELPTVAEVVPGYEIDQWHGVVTGAKVPRAIVGKLSVAIGEAMKSPEVVQLLSTDGSVPVGSGPEQFGAHIKSEIAKWRRLVKDAGLILR